MNVERIERAIKILRKVPPRKFNLETWADFSRAEMRAFKRDEQKPILNGCGTAGCAMGWIASNSTCRRDGLVLGIVHDWWDDRDVATPCFAGLRDYKAVEAFFALRSDTVKLLFCPDYYDGKELRSPAAVIERLETLLASGEELFRAMAWPA